MRLQLMNVANLAKNKSIYIESCKSYIIRTPLERPLVRALQISGWIKSLSRPEMRDLFLESVRVERVIKRLVGRTSNCIDVGCHLGSMLSFLIKLAPEGRHMAFEPIPQKAERLRRKFPEVEVIEVALGETAGKVHFFESLTRSGYSGLGQTGDPQDVVDEIIVDCERLDHYLREGQTVSFIKVDVEGAEFLVLRGGAELIRRDRPYLLFESVPGGVEKFGDDRRRFFAYLTEEMGYSIFLAADFLAGQRSLDWDRFDQAHKFPFKAMNYIGIPTLSSRADFSGNG
jgi:FkbM family methyltransferase